MAFSSFPASTLYLASSFLPHYIYYTTSLRGDTLSFRCCTNMSWIIRNALRALYETYRRLHDGFLKFARWPSRQF